MKKSRIVVYAVFVAFLFGLIPSVFALTEQEAINKVIDAESKVSEVVSSLKTWSNNHSASLKAIANSDFLDSLDTYDYESVLDKVIATLSNKGYDSAAMDLDNIKDYIVERCIFVENTFNLLEDYLKDNVQNGVIGNLDLFIQVRWSAINLKSGISDILDMYYNEYYNDVFNKLSSYDSVDEVIDIIDVLFDKLISGLSLEVRNTTLDSKLSEWQDLYNEYHLEDYEDLFKDYFKTFYDKFKVDYRKLYNKVENKLQLRLDNRIVAIENDTDITSLDSVLQRNKKLYDIMSYINDVKSNANDKFSKVNSRIKIPTVKSYVSPYEEEIVDRLDEAYDYTLDYVMDLVYLIIKNNSDKPNIKINNDRKYILTDYYNLLDDDFVDKFEALLGDVSLADSYNGKIGTLSKIQVYYNNILVNNLVLVIKGDVLPSGKLDITDVVQICNKMFGITNLNDYQLLAADLNEDGNINITDVVMLCNKIFN